jgi:hypothetical protein
VNYAKLRDEGHFVVIVESDISELFLSSTHEFNYSVFGLKK